METQSKIEQLKNQRRQERSRCRLSVSSPGAGACGGGRLSASVVSYKGGSHPNHAAHGAATEGTSYPKASIRGSIISNLTRAFRSIGEREVPPYWLEERMQRQRENKKRGECCYPAAFNAESYESDLVSNSPAPGKAPTASSATKQEHGRRHSEALRMTRRPPGVPVGPSGGDTPVLSPQMSPRGREVLPQAMFG